VRERGGGGVNAGDRAQVGHDAKPAMGDGHRWSASIMISSDASDSSVRNADFQ